MTARHFSTLDHLISRFDNGLKTLTQGANQATRRPDNTHAAATVSDADLMDEQQQKHIAGLMRINHTGEVCAQALYQGQALTAKNDATRDAMKQAADEEIDHLVWCEERLQDLNSQPSLLNPVFYGLSFSIGALTGAISDNISLGFVAATEDQVCKHLEEHLTEIPQDDHKTRAILTKMLEDEAHHAHMALEQGGTPFKPAVKQAMTLMSKVMTSTTYRL
ncbi:2-nonaprenyl-3-methyl-6-methoxy-1,4-benzoquinol hydroxylase [BD1-7 clade bacterium]|uniref:3-demethoxyubiquinol 3-hydroxylase n=1 Tax=BD1-7 clade bacterium TaxID=2029982 RepID=A0A5S9MNH3_9GAMM|nr:2-nonaprenyl-3-methyl-6-methoxy-1,4-benzoquinol hydroxylase [BD1-7 clade bacterium]CAA0085498.1 2-nonaprenyl-3-methyl-6-methoxy-1,4-benzoquinol hydroxylase [BD1-7 clade bacterium]